VVPAPIRLSGARFKSALIYLAGPGIEVLLVALLVLVFGYEALTSPPESIALLCAQATAAAALFGVFMNLIPLRTADGSMTDGLGFLTSPFLPDEVLESWRALPYTTRSEAALLSGKQEHAVSVLDEGSAVLQASLPSRVRLAQAYYEAGAADRAIELLDPLVARDDVPKALQCWILSILAMALIKAKPDRLQDAAEYTQYAIDMDRADVDVKLSRARVLIEERAFHEAQALLSSLEPMMSDTRSTDVRDTWRVLLELRRGNRATALAHLQRLRDRGARGVELDEVQRELGADVGGMESAG
jgi:tetratricopeptide (TPR) repeat protein